MERAEHLAGTPSCRVTDQMLKADSCTTLPAGGRFVTSSMLLIVAVLILTLDQCSDADRLHNDVQLNQSAVRQSAHAVVAHGTTLPCPQREQKRQAVAFLSPRWPMQVHAMVTVEKLRPDIPPEVDELPGGAFAGLGEYVNLMKACWAQDATARPDFETIIGRLRRLLAVESLAGRGGSGVRRPPATDPAKLEFLPLGFVSCAD